VGCAAAPPNQDFTLPSQILSDPVRDSRLKRLVIYNDSNGLIYGLDNSGKINVYLNGMGVGQLPIGKYVIVAIEGGTHTIKLEHRDIKLFKSTHEIMVSDDLQYLKISSTMTSNSAEIVPQPDEFSASYNPQYR
jgi:hypothetical protein